MPGLIDQNPGQADGTLPPLPQPDGNRPDANAPQPIKDRPDPSEHPDNVKLLVTRAAQYKDQAQSFWQNYPSDNLKLLTSQIPEEHHDTLASYTPDMVNWIEQREQFGGVPGALIKLRLKALAISDPVLRERELVQINDIAKLPKEEQQTFIAYAQNPDAFKGTDLLANGSASNVAGQVLGGGTVDPTTGEIKVSADSTTMGDVTTLEQMFPSLQGKIHFDDGQGITLSDWAESAQERATALATPIANPILQHGITPLSVGEAAVGVVMEAGTTPFQGLGAAINVEEGLGSSIARKAGIGAPVDWAIGHWEGIAGAGNRRFQRSMGVTSSTLGRLALEGRVPGTNIILRKGATQAFGKDYVPPSEETTNFVGQVVLAVSLHGASEAGGILTKSLGGPAEGVRAGMGISEDAGLGAVDLSLKDAAVHPLRSFVSPLVQKAAFDVIQDIHSTSWADWVQRGAAGRVFDFIDKVKENPAGMAQVRQRYPMLPEDYVRSMLDTAREDMPQRTLDYSQEVAKGKDLATLKAQQSSLQAKVNAQTRVVDEQRGLWEDAGRPTDPVNPVDQSSIDSLHSTLSSKRSAVEPIPGTPTTDGFLAESDAARFTRQLERRQAAGAVTDHGNGVFSWDEKGTIPRKYYVVTDGEGNVVHVRTTLENGSAMAETLEPESGKGYGTRALLKHWEDNGITDLSDPEQVARLQEMLSNGEFSNGGIKLNEAGIRALSERPDLLQGLLDEGTKLKDLNLQKAAQDELVADAAAAPSPVLRFPGRKTLPDFLHRVLYRPASLPEAFFRKVISPYEFYRWVRGDVFADDGAWLNPPKTPAVAKLIDKLSADAKITFIDPAESGVVRAQLEDQNTTILNRLLGKFKVSAKEQAIIMQALSDAKTQAEWREVVTKQLFGKGGTLDRALPDNIPPEFREAIIGTTDRNPMAFRHSVNGEPVLPGREIQGVPDPLPSSPNEFITQQGLPSPRAIEDALSGARRWSRNAQDAAQRYGDVRTGVAEGDIPASRLPNPVGRVRIRTAQAGAYTLDFARASLHLSTSVFKVPSLLFNLPAIILTKVLDEALGNANTPGIEHVLRTPESAVDYYMRIEPDALGSVVSGFFGDDATTHRFVENVSASQLLKNLNRDDSGALVYHGDNTVFASMIERLNQIHDDPMLRAFAQSGLDVEKMKGLLTGGDEVLTRFFGEQVAPQLENAGMDMDTWLGRWSDSIREATMNDPRWLDYAGNGKLQGAAHTATLPDGSEAIPRYERVQGDIEGIRNSLKDLNPLHDEDHPNIVALQKQLREKMSELRYIEEEARRAGQDVTDSGVIRADRQHPGAAVREMRRQLENNEIQLPDRIRVDRGTMVGGAQARSLPEMMDSWAMKFSNDLYSRSGRLSFQAIGRAEAKTARGNFFTQRYDYYTKEGIGIGLSEEDARASAYYRALDQTRDIFYDLTARSSVERSVRNVFWFAPVNGELLYRWLYAIPAQSGGLIPGLAILAAKAANYENIARHFGWIKKDELTGQDSFVIPGLSHFIAGVSGGRLRLADDTTLPVASLSPHLSGPIPELAPIPASGLNALADHIPALKGIASVIAPYRDVTFVPSSIRNALGIFGIKTPDFSQDYVNQSWDRVQDGSYQLAFVSLQREGDAAPTLGQFHLDPKGSDYSLTDANQKAYEDAWNSWFTRLSQRKDEYASGAFATKLINSAILPGTIQNQDPASIEFQKFWRSQVLPQLVPGQAMPDSVRATLDSWLGAHPDSLAFSISYNAYTGKTWQPSHNDTTEANYTDLYAHDVKATMDPEQYGPVMAALISRSQYTNRVTATLDSISPTGDPAEILRSWGKRSMAMQNNQIAWQNYLITHPDADAFIKTNQANMDKQYGIAPDSIEAHYVNDALLSLKALASQFTGEGGLSDQEYAATMGKLKAINSSLYKSTGGQLTPTEQGISDYFDKVLTPYMDKTQPLYDRAAKLSAAGKDATAIYDQIAKIKEQYDAPSLGGESYPSPDEFFYGSKDSQAQELAQLNWTTKPVSWLSSFQRRTVGYKDFAGEDEMFAQADAIKTQLAEAIDVGKVSPGSKQYDALQTWAQKAQLQIGHQYGAKGEEAMQLNLQDPYQRLRAQGYGSGNESMQTVYTMVDQVQQLLESKGLSAGGYSTDAIGLKQWVYGYIVNQENSDPQFKHLMTKLHLSQTPLPSGMRATGAPFWESVFFGNYNPAYIPNDLINSVPNGAI